MWRYRHTKGVDGDLQALLGETLHTLMTKAGLKYSSEWLKLIRMMKYKIYIPYPMRAL